MSDEGGKKKWAGAARKRSVRLPQTTPATAQSDSQRAALCLAWRAPPDSARLRSFLPLCSSQDDDDFVVVDDDEKPRKKPAAAGKAAARESDDTVCAELSGKRKVTVGTFKGRAFVNIREVSCAPCAPLTRGADVRCG